jgi:Type II secretion system (T2SS), protein E, N-terminal domain
VGEDGALCRVFVPRTAYSRCEFGPSAEELAARHWIASPAVLVEALAQQERAPVQPLGQALLALGLLTPPQLERVLQRLHGKAALGEALIDCGLVSRGDLQTALAHKMGFPLVDLERFPLDPQALALVPRRLALSHRVLPLMLHGERLIVAVDRPGRVLKLRQLDAYAQLPIVPALALKAQILATLNRP